MIIDGKYDGSFDDIKLELPNDSNEMCELLKPKFKENEDKTRYSVTFTIESVCSKFKWWAILLIVIGCVIVLAVVLVIIVLNNKTLKHKFLPYRKARKQNDINIQEHKNEIYEGKSSSKVNPMHS